MSLLCSLAKIGCVATGLSGPALVVDGDTIIVNHQAVRLSGVDAEEITEPNGIRAKLELRRIIGGAEVTCVSNGASYSRSVARCYIGEVEINKSMVASGWALDCPRYSGGRYRGDEEPGARRRLIQKPYC